MKTYPTYEEHELESTKVDIDKVILTKSVLTPCRLLFQLEVFEGNVFKNQNKKAFTGKRNKNSFYIIKNKNP